ncbi:zwei Ig domain protein zig-8-like [Phlebotomus papatasi]|uniref:Ig-like domain-containing protein n=1 Tax=Phlebotomus papatasi TaxID=29031 RepID=A0A1B0DDV7_PHLPP|nr:zwei Ig domain protein zig-8-like [Phlebotomus papatasi]XP_055707379.1 zwei Ig domain protein zig-8-like [Phlebotomus papatasi]
MSPEVGQILVAVALFLGSDAIRIDTISHGHQSRRSGGTDVFSSPFLAEHRVTNITTQIGTHAYLPCKARQLANKSVSWVRVRDDHILTVDRTVFIADDRFQSFYVEGTGMWTLQLKYVQARDAGIYECQVSTEPKVSARVHLHVVVPRTELDGEPNRYVKAGSKVIIRCVVRGALEPPAYVFWYFGLEQIFTDNRYGWTMQTDSESETHNTIASLIIPSARKRDAGNYTCNPSNSDAVTVLLHVINVEYSASAVKSAASGHGSVQSEIVAIIVAALVHIQT